MCLRGLEIRDYVDNLWRLRNYASGRVCRHAAVGACYIPEVVEYDVEALVDDIEPA